MSFLVNDPARFTDEMAEGFCAVHADIVRRVPGGVVRREPTPAGQVAVVIGGGSGHYPAFAGLVGRGLAHGAVMGNVFASPPARDVVSVARAAQAGAGVLLCYGNYAGDVLNFDLGQEQLRAEGIPVRTVTVTDDISSAAPDERHRRRGIAGTLPVFRAAAWAAEQGRDLDGVWELATRANARTRTLGVAFSGCTLPGAGAPLFTLPPGTMAIGMGIHGEPGLSEQSRGTAEEIARLLVERVLAQAPETPGSRVAVVVNGLGSVKSEELFVLYRSVGALLGAAGLNVVRPEVGEYATSFEMAGVSLTLAWLDEELEASWSGPALTPAFRRGIVTPVGTTSGSGGNVAEGGNQVAATAPDTAAGSMSGIGDVTAGEQDEVAVPAASERSRASARCLAELLAVAHTAIDAQAEELGRLDAVAGDGDHGIGMRRGSVAAARAAAETVAAQAGARTTLIAAADAWASAAGGTSGALWGIGLRTVGEGLSDTGEVTPGQLADGVRAARDAIAAAGSVSVGDKTMLDALDPFAGVLAEGVAAGLTGAWNKAAEAARTAADRTDRLVPRTGRARTHAERSVGTRDPGAVSFAIVVAAVATGLQSKGE
jgi:dihydroxyacetone kinase